MLRLWLAILYFLHRHWGFVLLLFQFLSQRLLCNVVILHVSMYVVFLSPFLFLICDCASIHMPQNENFQYGLWYQPVFSLSLQSRRQVSTAQLEDRANSETDNPRVQARYLEAVLERDPHYVVRRFESGRYAVDSSVRQIYQQALERLDQEEHKRTFNLGTTATNTSDPGLGSSFGARDNTVHIVTLPQRGGWFKELWSLARFIIIAFFITTFISSALMTQMKSGCKSTHTHTLSNKPCC